MSEQLATETKEKLKFKENLQFEKERADELEKVREHIFCMKKKTILEKEKPVKNLSDLSYFSK